jgi:mRNA-degrading endonuclease toxin of MazEF toxin-antitoxin module
MTASEADTPKRGEVWLVDFRPGKGFEVSDKTRRALVVSTDAYNRSGRGFAMVCPITTNVTPIAARVRVDPPEGGQTKPGMIMCDFVRTLSVKGRFQECLGAVSATTMEQVENRLRLILEL